VIARYRTCPYAMYHSIAETLDKNFDAIINSFIMLEKSDGDKARLSNGPVESLNRITKDMKRVARGFQNFEFIRNRFLFATRTNAAILGVPKKLEDTYLQMSPEPPDSDDYLYDENLEDDWEAFDEE